ESSCLAGGCVRHAISVIIAARIRGPRAAQLVRIIDAGREGRHPMLSRIRAATRMLRPRALARTAKSVDDLVAGTTQLQRSMKEALAEAARQAERAERLEARVKSLEESL